MKGEIELNNISFLILKVELHFKHATACCAPFSNLTSLNFPIEKDREFFSLPLLLTELFTTIIRLIPEYLLYSFHLVLKTLL